MFTCLKRNDKKEVKVAQLAGSVGEQSAYHHGEASLMGTIINLAQNYVGSNNINLLQPIGQFGTRLAGGEDSASPRYIFTQMSPLARNLFNENDDAVLNYLLDDNTKIEPEWYIPIIPMVLVNGADGIGTGWMTKVPNYDPREIVRNLKKMLAGEEAKPMTPWFKNFRGSIEALDHQRFVVNGEVSHLSDTKVEITELPVKSWTNAYKEMLEGMMKGNEKTPPQISNYRDYNTDSTVKFIVEMKESDIEKAENVTGIHTFFKLQTTISTSSMVLFDHLGCLRKYENVEQILKEYYTVRLELYDKRKKFMVGMLESEAGQLSNKARFILEKCDGTLKIENKKKKIMIEELVSRGYDSDPIKAFKKSQAENEEEIVEDEDDEEKEKEEDTKGPDFDYLLGMPMWNLTQEKKDAICKQRDDKQKELKKLLGTAVKQLWENDLTELLKKLDEVEAKEQAEAAEAKPEKGAGKKGGKGKKGAVKMEVLPSAHAIRIEPRIADDLKVKVAKIAAAKERKAANKDVKKAVKKVKGEDKDEFDDMAKDQSMNGSLTKRVGSAKKGKGGGAGGKKVKAKNPWSDSDADDVSDGDVSDAMEDVPVSPREKAAGGRRAAAAAKKYVESEDEVESEHSDDDDEMYDNEGIKEETNGVSADMDQSVEDEGADEGEESAEEIPSPPPKKKPAPAPKAAPKAAPKPAPVYDDGSDDDEPEEVTNGNSNGAAKDVFDVSDSGSEFEVEKAAKKAPAKKAAKPASDFDDEEESDYEPAPKKAPARKSAAKKKYAESDDENDDDDSDFDLPKPKKAKTKKSS